MARSFRTIFRHLVPSWLSTGDGEKVLFTLAMIADGFVDRVRLGLEARFPSRARDTALEEIGNDRGIFRGRNEARARYAARLKAWRYPRGHRVRGNAFALLEQLSAYFGGTNVWTVDASGNRRKRTHTGLQQSDTFSWPWEVPDLARFWVVLALNEHYEGSPPVGETPAFGDPDLWGGELGTPGYTLGHTGITPEDVRAIRRLFEPPAWYPLGVVPEWVIVPLSFSFPEPDANWSRWSYNNGGLQSPTRGASFRFWALTPYVYAGDPTNFPTSSYLVDLSVYSGDPDSFPLSAELPDGSTYSGDPASFPLSARLPDDGDLPT